jgi:predicted O-methyltransferase YrrM
MNSVEYAASICEDKYPHILEFGVYSGKTISQIRNNLNGNFAIYGFDSFEGVPEDWENTPCHKGFFSTGGVAPQLPEDIKLFVGWFEDTIPEYLKIAKPISLLHIDCDLYSSTKTVFDALHEYIKSGTIIVFDEWCYNQDPECNDHEQKAFYEYVDDYNVKFKFVDFYDSENWVERKIVKIL